MVEGAPDTKAGISHTILVVEDEAPDLALVRKTVADLWPACRIVPVHSLREACAAFGEHNFDMVLLDLNLPDGFGTDTVAQMRAFNRRVPIVVMTGHVTDDTVYEALRLGANHIVPKAGITGEDFANILEENANVRI